MARPLLYIKVTKGIEGIETRFYLYMMMTIVYKFVSNAEKGVVMKNLKFKFLFMLFLGITLVVPVNFAFAIPPLAVDEVGAGVDLDIQKVRAQNEINTLKDKLFYYVRDSYAPKMRDAFYTLWSYVPFAGDDYYTEFGGAGVEVQKTFEMLQEQKKNGRLSESDLQKFNKYREVATKNAKLLFSLGNDLRSKINLYNKKFHAGDVSSSEYADVEQVLKDVGFDEDVANTALVLGFSKAGDRLKFKTTGWSRTASGALDMSELDSLLGEDDAGSKKKTASSDRSWYMEDDDADEDKDETNIACPECEKESNTQFWTRTVLGAVGLIGAGVMARQNYIDNKRARNQVFGMMDQYRAQGRNPYVLMPLAQQVIARQPFDFLGGVLPPVMMMLAGPSGNATRGEFMAAQQQQQQNRLFVELIRQQQQGTTSVSRNQTETIQYDRKIQGLRDLSKAFQNAFDPNAFNHLFDQVGRELRGGMDERQYNEYIKEMSNFAQVAGQYQQFVGTALQGLDQMKLIMNGLAQGARNMDQDVNGNGGVTYTRQRTVSDNSSSNFSGQGQSVGPRGGFQPGNAVNGGGWNVQARGGNGRVGVGVRGGIQ